MIFFCIKPGRPDQVVVQWSSGRDIELWADFYGRFSTYFIAWKRQSMTIIALSAIVQGKKEILQSYIDCFTQVVGEVEGAK